MNEWSPSGQWQRRFREALIEVFPSDPSLNLLVTDYFDPLSFLGIAPPGVGQPFESRVADLISYARMDGWLMDLLAAAHERRPRSKALANLAEDRGLGLTGPRLDNPTGKPLEALIMAGAAFINPMTFIERLPFLAGQVCAIDMPGMRGTGFLVGPDVVLTNYHVVEPLINNAVSPANVRCWFDHKEPADGSTLELKPRTEIALDVNSWLIDKRPPSPGDSDPAKGLPTANEVDCVLVRLEDKIGDSPVRGSASAENPERRGWIDVAEDAQPLAAGNQLFLLQHPQGEPLQLAVGTVTGFNGNGTRLRYDANSKKGSSGAPCFNADLQLVALHHARDPDYPPKWNQGIPFGTIQKVWRDNGVAVT